MNSRCGSSSPAASSIAGQITAWNLRMSLARICSVAGHSSAVRSRVARAERERRVVVEQRVEPDVEDVRGIPRDLDAPGELGAAERDVVEAAGDERARLVEARRRERRSRAVGVELLELLLEGGEPEEPVLLLLAVERDAVDRAGVALRDLVLGLEVRAAGAVPALVQALVDVPVVVHALHERLDALLVARVARADEEVVGGVDARHQRLEAGARCGRRAPSA